MSISDWIQVVAICISLACSAIAIIQTKRAMDSTERSTKDANRPYVSIYLESIDTIGFSRHIVIKNFGNTSAKILKIHVEGLPTDVEHYIDFSNLIDGFIAPGQKFTSSIDDDFNNILFVNIVYQELTGEIHDENYTLKTDMTDSFIYHIETLSSDSDEITAIKHATHAIIKSFK